MKSLVVAVAMLAGAAGWPAASLAQVAGIETGADLTAACREHLELRNVATAGSDEFDEAEMRERLAGNRCRQYMVGFAQNLQHFQAGGDPVAVLGVNEEYRGACIRMPDFVSYDQLAAMIVSEASEAPELMDEEAVNLLFQTFAENFPCPEDWPQAP